MKFLQILWSRAALGKFFASGCLLAALLLGTWVICRERSRTSGGKSPHSEGKPGSRKSIDPHGAVPAPRIQTNAGNSGHQAGTSGGLIPKVVSENSSPLGRTLSGGTPRTTEDRVTEVQRMDGRTFTEADLASSFAFLAGSAWPKGLATGDAHWLADELLTALRLQQPPWEGLAAALAEVAFQPQTDPVIRDYIVQHLGHLWEQFGARKEIEQALWRAAELANDGLSHLVYTP